MKEWKKAVVDQVIREAESCRIVSLRETARAMGIDHIAAGDCRDIMNAAQSRLVDYRPVRMMRTSNDSLFCSLHFIENGVEFGEGGAE